MRDGVSKVSEVSEDTRAIDNPKSKNQNKIGRRHLILEPRRPDIGASSAPCGAAPLERV